MKKVLMWLALAMLTMSLNTATVNAEEISTESQTTTKAEETTKETVKPTEKETVSIPTKATEATTATVTTKPTTATQAPTEAAVSGTISVSAEDGLPGSNVGVTFSVSGKGLSSVAVTLSYDGSLKLVSCSGGSVTGGTNLVIPVSNGTSASATVTFKISDSAKLGDTYAIGATAYFGNGKNSFNQDSIVVKDKNAVTTQAQVQTAVQDYFPNKAVDEPESSDTNLESITVKGYKLSPAFDKNVVKYKVTVPNSVTSLDIKATVVDNRSDYRVTGNKELKVGENTVKVICTSEDGLTKVYTIMVTREGDTKEKETITAIDENGEVVVLSQSSVAEISAKTTGVPIWLTFVLCVVFLGIGFGICYFIFVGFEKN